ncbi:MAG: energy transducer TonB [Bacteroidales bacterium]|nr:energy transducer TonB [Bacteroidales bacterium]
MENKPEKKRVLTFDDIVFEFRNKAYGSYLLRKRFGRYLIIGFIIALIAVSSAVAVPFIKALTAEDEEIVLAEEKSVVMETIDVEEDLAPPPPPPPPPSAAEQTVRYTAPVVVDTVQQEVQLAIVDDVRESVTNEPVPEEIIEVIEEEESVIIEEEPAFVFVEEQATFRGGDLNDFRLWVQENIIYPPLAIENNIFGRVTVQFAVNSQGEVVDVVILRGVDPTLDGETRRVILSSPRWQPARQGGRAVKQQFTIPVVFTLTE